jgi:uncharacterized protein
MSATQPKRSFGATRQMTRDITLRLCQPSLFALIRRNSRSSSGFSRNLRKEVSKQDKIYFWDLGVRNAAIDNLKQLAERDDVGALWENFILAERLKWLHYHQTLASLYFWRTYTGAEIDIVEEREGGIYAYECKWSRPAGHASRAPESFLAAYPGASFEVITRESHRAYLGA